MERKVQTPSSLPDPSSYPPMPRTAELAEPIFLHHALVASTELTNAPAIELRVATRTRTPWPSGRNAWFTMDAGACTVQAFLSPDACRALAAGLLQAAQHLDVAAAAETTAGNLQKVAP
jgi:hypothetical protein